MDKEFVPYEQALELKELGFDEPCLGWYVSESYGLDIEVPQLTLWLDEKFQEFIKIPEFKYYQIKTKFGYGRFYCDGVPQEQITEVEVKIRELCK